MTGHGSARRTVGESTLIVEMRSVNHKHLEVRVHAPREYVELAAVIERLARTRLERGHVDVFVRLEFLQSKAPISVEQARDLFAQLVRVRDAVAPREPVPFSMLAAFAERLGPLVSGDALQGATTDAVDEALSALIHSRQTEGEALLGYFRAASDRIVGFLGQLELLTTHAQAAWKVRFTTRMREWLADTTLDESRLAHETARAIERADVTEEFTRLRSHLSYLATVLANGGGRKLDFLLQEMLREANTLSSKSLSPEVTHVAVDLKAELERMREQAQNIE